MVIEQGVLVIEIFIEVFLYLMAGVLVLSTITMACLCSFPQTRSYENS